MQAAERQTARTPLFAFDDEEGGTAYAYYQLEWFQGVPTIMQMDVDANGYAWNASPCFTYDPCTPWLSLVKAMNELLASDPNFHIVQ